ncbi:MAG: hypothetical protein HC831_24195 [Chloroflexia bacterium]|nr:hypothetical protein [Bacteroidales bacterium]NJO91719.1 hypothetical protein [Chloroflexia bacterium]
MKRNITGILLLFFITSCATYTEFPVSHVAPAATIKVKEKKDKNENTLVSVTANNLASAERLDPSKEVYVVWMSTQNNGIKNLGQLMHKNAKKSTLEAITAFEPVEIFITAEDQGNITRPSDFEISRVALVDAQESSLNQ